MLESVLGLCLVRTWWVMVRVRVSFGSLPGEARGG